MADPLAYPSDVETLWRPLTAGEGPRVLALLAAVSRRVRRLWPDVDARVAAGDLDAAEVADVVANVVKRVLISGDTEGIESRSQTAGPFAVSDKYANPMGNIYFTADERAVFDAATAPRALTVWAG